jgi:hypothetical protein
VADLCIWIQCNDEKIAFLQEHREVRSVCLRPWMVAGDFNLIYKDEDKNNSNYSREMRRRFRRFINDLALKERYLFIAGSSLGRMSMNLLPLSDWIECLE